MPRREKKGAISAKNVKLIAGAVAAVFVAVVCLGSYAGIPGLPTWDEIYKAVGLTKTVEVEGNLTVHYIDVGQSDSTLIICGDKNILIDAGDNSTCAAMVAYLKQYGIKKIDLLVATHPHADHIGGMDDVINNFEVGTILMSKVPDDMIPATASYTDMLKAIKNKGLSITKSKPGDIYKENDAVFTVIAPIGEYNDLNEYSVVLRLDYGSTSFLFSGDCASSSEKDILKSGENVNVDVLSVAHHGSKTSSTKDYLAAVTPKYAVISLGEGNSYGFPTKEALGRLRDVGATVYRTDLSGTIVITSDGNNLTVNAEKNAA